MGPSPVGLFPGQLSPVRPGSPSLLLRLHGPCNHVQQLVLHFPCYFPTQMPSQLQLQVSGFSLPTTPPAWLRLEVPTTARETSCNPKSRTYTLPQPLTFRPACLLLHRALCPKFPLVCFWLAPIASRLFVYGQLNVSYSALQANKDFFFGFWHWKETTVVESLSRDKQKRGKSCIVPKRIEKKG